MAEEINNDMEIVADETLKKDNIAENTEKADKKKKLKKDKKDILIEELGAKLEEISDKHLRLQAEFDNFRKRTLKEKTELIKNGGEEAFVGLLPVIDDFERAVKTLETATDLSAVKEGIMLIYSKFMNYLQQNGVKPIETLGQDFDPEMDEAVAMIPATDENQKGKVIDSIQTGYTLYDKVIRHAKVVVAN